MAAKKRSAPGCVRRLLKTLACASLLFSALLCVYLATTLPSDIIHKNMSRECETRTMEEMDRLTPLYSLLHERSVTQLTKFNCVDATPSAQCELLYENVAFTIGQLFNRSIIEKRCINATFLDFFELGRMHEKAMIVKTSFQSRYRACFNQIAYNQMCTRDFVVV